TDYTDCADFTGRNGENRERDDGHKRPLNTRLSLLSVPDAIKLGGSADDQTVARNGGCGHAHLPQAVLANQFVFRAGLDDEGVAILAQAKQLVVISPGRSGETRSAVRVEALLVVSLGAGFGVATTQEPEIKEHVKVIAIDERRGVVGRAGL